VECQINAVTEEEQNHVIKKMSLIRKCGHRKSIFTEYQNTERIIISSGTISKTSLLMSSMLHAVATVVLIRKWTLLKMF
jgi:hypothetical protein